MLSNWMAKVSGVLSQTTVYVVHNKIRLKLSCPEIDALNMVQIKLPFTFVLAAAAIAPVVALLFVPGARANDIADGSGGNLDGGHRGNPRETFDIIEKARDDSEPPGGKGKGKGKGRGKGKGKGQKGGGGSGGGSGSDTPPEPFEQFERSFDDLDLEAREYDYLD